MTPVFYILGELFFLGFIVGVANIQADIFARQKSISHFWWGMFFAGLIIGEWFLDHRNYWFGGALVLEHFVFFSPILNFCRKPRQAFFYIHSDPKKGSIWDQLLKPNIYPYIWAAGLIAFGWIQTKFL